ncbi:DUF5686 and carboxypeptidase regulatory-like domain-containing protein [Chitinophagaceae bacterium MMS25-I14]
MYTLKVLSSLIVCCLFSIAAQAGLLKGRITDSKGLPLSFATVYVQGTTTGTNANALGEYELQLAPGTYKVIGQYIGFKQSVYNATITGNETVIHNFSLDDQNMIKEVVVKATDEDPAYRIIRKTIARRSFHNKQMKSFQTGIYLKGALRNGGVPDKLFGFKVSVEDKKEMGKSMGGDSEGRSVIFMVEETADYYTELPNKKRTVIHSVKQSGDPNGLGFSEFPEVISFYDNNINISDQLNPRGFVSPIADNALSFYKYKLLGEYKEDGRVINKIQVTPKRLYEPTFQGIIYIVDEDWALHSLDVFLTKKSNMEFLDTFRVKQLYLPLKQDTWVIKSQVMGFDFSLLGMLNLTGNSVTVYSNQKVNEPIPDTIFNDKIVSVYDKDANKKDSAYWKETRPVPLAADEVHDYQFKDSVYVRTHDPKYIDSMRRRRNKLTASQVFSGGITQYGKDYKTTTTVSSILQMTNFNTVEGLNLAPKISYTRKLDTGNSIHARVAARYGFSNTHFNAIGSLEYTHHNTYWYNRSWSLAAQGGKYVFQYNPDNPISEYYNSVSSLVWQHNYMKIYERWDGTLRFNQNLGNGFRWGLSGAYQKRLPLENTTDYNWMKTDQVKYTGNVPQELSIYPWEEHSAVIAKGYISYQPGYTYTLYPDRKVSRGSDWPVFTLSYEKGIPDILNSKTDYDKWRFGIKGDARLNLFGSLSYNVAAGGFLNDKYVSLPDLMHIDGNEIALASPFLQSFQLASYYRFSNTQRIYGEAHVEYYLKGLLTNKIPLLRQARWYFVLGNNTFYANQNFYHTEAFIGVDNLGFSVARFLRLDYVHSWDGYGKQYNGIRIGISPNSLFSTSSVNVKNGEGEW